jgi:hypothetical protein
MSRLPLRTSDVRLFEPKTSHGPWVAGFVQPSHADGSEEAGETRFIEVKGRAGIGDIALTANEYKTAQSLGDDYWLYVVFNSASKPQVIPIQNPAKLEWEALSKIDCYRIEADRLPLESS